MNKQTKKQILKGIKIIGILFILVFIYGIGYMYGSESNYECNENKTGVYCEMYQKGQLSNSEYIKSIENLVPEAEKRLEIWNNCVGNLSEEYDIQINNTNWYFCNQITNKSNE